MLWEKKLPFFFIGTISDKMLFVNLASWIKKKRIFLKWNYIQRTVSKNEYVKLRLEKINIVEEK